MNLKIHQSTVNVKTCLKMKTNASNNKNPETSKIKVCHDHQQ